MINNKINEYLNNSFDEKDFCDILDKETRSFGTYFYEKFKENQIIINTFCLNEIFRPKTFKIILFIITIELYFIITSNKLKILKNLNIFSLLFQEE